MADESLTAFVDEVCGSRLRVEDDLGDGFVRLRSAEAERRQAAHDIRSTEDIVIELLRNARDARALNIFLAVSREGTRRRLTMLDDGDGIPPTLHERVFEPRVTSKLDTMHVDKWGVHGRGMALYSIAVNAEESHIASSQPASGTAIVVETDLARVGERTDQSTFPSFERTGEGTVAIRGPRNILRTACEFALEHRRGCTVFLGSPTDIAATLYAFGASSLSSAARAFCPDPAQLPVCKRLAAAADPASLAELAAGMGLMLSERSARRIMDGELAPLEPLIERIELEGEKGAPHPQPAVPARGAKSASAAIGVDARGLKIERADLDELAARVREAYADIAERYYLEPDVKPDVRAAKDGIRITIPVGKLR